MLVMFVELPFPTLILHRGCVCLCLSVLSALYCAAPNKSGGPLFSVSSNKVGVMQHTCFFLLLLKIHFKLSKVAHSSEER